MNINETIPNRLYKYRAFSNRTLDMLGSDKLHFADPCTFNDPMDTRAYVEVDVEEDVLASVLRALVEQRVTAEMRAAAKTLRVDGDKVDAHIQQASRDTAAKQIADIEYHATNPDYDDVVAAKRDLFRRDINDELLRRYDRGIVSLTARADCPLMWSHYGDQHRGVCVGYSVPAEATGDVRKVLYDGNRVIEVSKIAAMLDGDDLARRKVDEAALLQKARDWGYEQEWRLLGARGFNHSPLELREIVFGMRCEDYVKFGVMRALQEREGDVGFRELREEPGSFDVRGTPLNYDDGLFRSFPNRYLSVIDGLRPYLIPVTRMRTSEDQQALSERKRLRSGGSPPANA